MKSITLKDISPTVPQLTVVHYLLSERSGEHVAHCLDLDLLSVGESREVAVKKLDNLVKSHIEFALGSGRLVNLATKAPQRYWNEFMDGEQVELDPKTIRIEIPSTVQVVPLSESEVGILARTHRTGK